MSKFSLADDGTLDTVVACDDCGEEVRYYTDLDDEDCEAEKTGDDCGCYDRFVAWAKKDAEEHHECLEQEVKA